MYKKIVVKIGTNVITKDNGLLDEEIMKNLVSQIAEIKKREIDVTLVSSGAMGAGRSLINLPERCPNTTKRQILASIGQVKLIHTYAKLFGEHDLLCAQVLATKEDFRDRAHYINMHNCLRGLLKYKIVPVINENDVISVSELMFTDNDELAGLIASMIDADALIVLTTVDGIFDRNPHEEGAKPFRMIDAETFDVGSYITPAISSFGRGGMLTKCKTAYKVALLGISTHIVNGKSRNVVLDTLDGKEVGTTFIPKKKASGTKRWVAHSESQAKGILYINKGAYEAISSKEKANSLLPVGVTKIEGEFKKGDMIKIKNEQGKEIGIGMANYSSLTAKQNIGQKGKEPVIHYDYLFVRPKLQAA